MRKKIKFILFVNNPLNNFSSFETYLKTKFDIRINNRNCQQFFLILISAVKLTDNTFFYLTATYLIVRLLLIL